MRSVRAWLEGQTRETSAGGQWRSGSAKLRSTIRRRFWVRFSLVPLPVPALALGADHGSGEGSGQPVVAALAADLH